MKQPLTSTSDNSQLAIIDIQVRLLDAMPSESVPQLIKNISALIQAARTLQVPLLYTEQYPKGLGKTTPALAELLSSLTPIEKTAFSCAAVPAFNRQLTSDRPQVILAGMEAHICILQTALDLHQQGKQVFVVEDAILSRTTENKANAIHRLRQAGIIVTTTESVIFEWLKNAQHEAFKHISKLIL